MKLFGSIKELVSAVFRKDSQEITVRPNQSTTYTAARDIQLPPGDSAHVLTSASSTQTLTNKTIAAGSNTISGLANANIDAAAAIDATKLGNGDVDNTELSKLNGLSGSITTDSNSQTLTNKTIDGDANTVQDLAITSLKTVLGDANKVLRRDASGVPQSGNTLPNSSDIVTIDASQAVSNKTIDNTNAITVADGNLIIQDNADAAKQMRFEASGITSGQTRILTAPDTDGTLTLNAASQVITNKDIDGGTASNTSRVTLPKASSGTLAGLTRKEGTLVYDTSLAKVLFDNGSTLTAVGSGSGTGEINAILNASAADATTGWSNGTSHTISRVTSGSPLDPVTTTAFSISATSTASESSTSGSYYSFTMPPGLQNRKLKVEFFYTTSASQTWNVSVYQGSTRVPLSTDSSGASTLAAGVTGQKFTAYFDTDSNTTWTVALTRTAGSGTTTLTFTNIIVGPGIQPQGAIISSPVAYTPTTQGLGTVSNTDIVYWREGEYLNIDGKLDLGTVSASEARIGLPSGLTIATYAQNTHIAGVWSFNLGTANTDKHGWLLASSGHTYLRWALEGEFSTTSSPLSPINGNAGLTSSATTAVSAKVRIAEWAGSGTLNTAQNDLEYVYSTDETNTTASTAFGYGPQGSLFPQSAVASANIDKIVQFQTPIGVRDTVVLEVSGDSGATWSELSATSDDFDVQPYARQTTGINYGVYVTPISTTQARVRFGKYKREAGGAYGAAGSDWGVQTTRRWRVKKYVSGTAVGFGLAGTDGSAGLYKAGQAPGITTGVSIGSGYIGQEIKGTFASTNVTTGSNQTVTSVTLTPGRWSLSFHIYAQGGGGQIFALAGIATATNSQTGWSKGDNSSVSNTTAGDESISLSNWVVDISSSTTYYLTMNVGGATTTCWGRLSAIRIA